MKHLIWIFLSFTLLCGQSISERVQQANEHVEKGELNEALKLYESALEIDKTNATIWYNLGNAYFKAENFAKARECYTEALNFKEPNELADVNFNIGNTYFYESKPDTAIQYYKRSLELNDQDLDAKYNLELARAILKEKAKKEQQQQQQNQDQKKNEKPPSEFAKQKFKEAMELADKGMFREALDLLNRAKQTDPTVSAFQKTIKNLEDIVRIIES